MRVTYRTCLGGGTPWLIEVQRALSRAKVEGVEDQVDLDLATSVLAEAIVRFPRIAATVIERTPDLATSSKQRFLELQSLAPFARPGSKILITRKVKTNVMKRRILSRKGS